MKRQPVSQLLKRFNPFYDGILLDSADHFKELYYSYVFSD